MSEYFVISLIAVKSNTSKSELDTCLTKLGLTEGVVNSKLFDDNEVIVSYMEDDESDFDEMSVSVSEQLFTRENLDIELEKLTFFVNQCFQCNPHIKYALCSYELNGYLIGPVKRIQDFTDGLLKRFPIVYKRVDQSDLPRLEINLAAQDILE